MAEITFGVWAQQNITASGLGFYGATHGASVQIGSYQDSTFVTNDTGADPGPEANNVKLVNVASGTWAAGSGIPLTRTNSGASTFHINFDHSAAVRVQNAQLVIYNRSNTQYPASGVVTKVAELANFYNRPHGTSAGTEWHYPENIDQRNTSYEAAYGSGDCFWWGAPFPAAYCTASNVVRYLNSSGIKFYNGDDTVGDNINGDTRLSSLTVGAETVGGTGVIMPLLNSPGSGGQWLNQKNAGAIMDGGNTADTLIQPKWYQYSTGNFDGLETVVPGIDPGSKGVKSSDASAYATQGGTGVDMRHTWFIAMSASPLSIGSKTDYGLYVSLEYL